MIIVDSSADAAKIKLLLLIFSSFVTLAALGGQFFHPASLELKLIALAFQCFALRCSVQRFNGKDASYSYLTVEADPDQPSIHIGDLVMLLPSIFTLIFFIHPLLS